jgi:hypothetical protein
MMMHKNKRTNKSNKGDFSGSLQDRSLAELAPSYEVATAYLVHMLEARFVNLNPFMQQMFLKLHDIEDSEKKDFILETDTSQMYL